ncbi:MAG: DUF3667 domain-containing protein [Acidobacteriota bacterium]
MPDIAPSDCSNCDRPRSGQYCSHCGQKAFDHRRPLRELLGEFQHQVLAFDARIWKSLKALLIQPGRLTVVYNAGRRHAFVPPVRLYLLVSFFFFLAMPFANPEIVTFSETPSRNAPVVEATPADPLSPPEESAQPATDSKATAAAGPAAESAGGGFFERRFTRLAVRYQNPQDEINRLVSRRIPQTVFFLVPMLALVLKLLYLRRKVYYVEHLVFAVHGHAFIFATLLVAMLLQWGLEATPWDPQLASFVPMTCLPLYLFLALKRVYGQGSFLTAFKTILVGVLYSFLLLVALLTVLVVTLALI